MAATSDPLPQAQRVTTYFAPPDGERRYYELLHYTERLVRSKHWCMPTEDDTIPGGMHARDIVHETYQALTKEPGQPGFRKLPDNVEVEPALKMDIWSMVSHAVESYENTHRADRVDHDHEGKPLDRLDTDAPFWDPSQAKLTPLQQAHVAARCTRFIEFTKKDSVVCNMLMVIRDQGFDRPAERLAKALGIKVPEVYTARKRLGTLLRQFRKTAAP